MLDELFHYFLTQPRRLTNLGHALVRAGGFFTVLGVIGNAVTTTLSVVRGLSNQTLPVFTVADFLPRILSWWVPESAFWFGFWLLLMLAGFAAVHTGRAYERMLRY